MPQGCFPSAHAVRCSPQPDVWTHVCNLAHLRRAVLHHQLPKTTVAHCAVSLVVQAGGLREHAPYQHARLAPDGSLVAFSAPVRVFPFPVPVGTCTELPPVPQVCRSVGVWSKNGSFAFLTAGPAGKACYAVTIHHFQAAPQHQQTLHLACRHPGELPEVAWSACTQFLYVMCFEDQQIVDVKSAAVTRLTSWPGSWAWAPSGSCFLHMTHALDLELLSIDGGQPSCMAQLDVSAAFDILHPHGSVWDFAEHHRMDCKVGASRDCGQAVLCLAGDNLKAYPVHVAVARLAGPPALLGQCVLAGTTGSFLRSVSVGVEHCAVCVDDSVFIISIAARTAASVLHILAGVQAALSPCNTFVAVVRRVTRRQLLSIASLSTGNEVSSWSPWQLADVQKLDRSCAMWWSSSGSLYLDCDLLDSRVPHSGLRWMGACFRW